MKYLGIVLSEDEKPDNDRNAIVAATGRPYHALNRGILGKCKISTRTKLAVSNFSSVPTVTYRREPGAEICRPEISKSLWSV